MAHQLPSRARTLATVVLPETREMEKKKNKNKKPRKHGRKEENPVLSKGRPVGWIRHTSPGNPFPDGVPELSPEVLNSVVEPAREPSDSSTLRMK